MNLRDQLLKAGLVSKKQADQVEANRRKHSHDAKKNNEIAEKINSEKTAELAKIEEEKNRQKEYDKELNRKRDFLILQREAHYRSRQILNSNYLNEKDASESYYFEENRKIRKIMVTAWQREMLARGKMGIGRPQEDVDDFVIIPLTAAKIIKEIYPQKLITLHSEIDTDKDLDSNF